MYHVELGKPYMLLTRNNEIDIEVSNLMGRNDIEGKGKGKE